MKRILIFATMLISAGVFAADPVANFNMPTQEEIELLKRLKEEARAKMQVEIEKLPRDKIHKTASGLEFIEVKEGDGKFPERGQTVQVHYTGWLMNGTKFDSSERELYEFQIGYDRVIPGWDEGVAGMKVGGKRRLIIPPRLGYGDRGRGQAVPPNAALIFDVELVKIVESEKRGK